MRCPSCGFDNPEGLKFCNECGTPLQMSCAQCGFANQPQAKFCGECGAALASPFRASTAPPLAPRLHTPLSYTPDYLGEKILYSKTALEGERKQVTVLFADLKGSMELSADRDPEDGRAILDPVLERMMDAVHRYEGTVNQVMRDGIMALFGAPIAHEDHAVRACYAALAMQTSVKHYAGAGGPGGAHDRLPPEEKRLLQTAAVVGTEVPLPLVQAIAGLPEAALHRALAHLQAAEFLYETRLFPELAYTFKHALTQEVAYGSLLQERRCALHARIVSAIETLYAERLAEQVERLAQHAIRGLESLSASVRP